MESFISNDELSNLLIKDYQNLEQGIYQYNSMDDYDKKTFLLSCFFALKIFTSFNYIEPIISLEHREKIIKIVNNQKFDISLIHIGFYLSQFGYRSCVENHTKKTSMRVPTKSEYLFKNIDDLNIDSLKEVLLNCNYTNVKENDVAVSREEELYNKLFDVLTNNKVVKRKYKYLNN